MTSKQQLLINDIVSYMEVLKNVYGITPEFIWNNLNPTHRIYVNDDSIKRCQEHPNIEANKRMSISINVGKEVTFVETDKDCYCHVCDEEFYGSGDESE
jgi:hypothetical protein